MVSLNTYLKFRVAAFSFGISIQFVEEICGNVKMTRLPCAPHYIPGIFVFREDIVPLFNLENFFGFVDKTRSLLGSSGGLADFVTTFNRIIIVNTEEIRAGLICDQVQGINEINRSQIIRQTADEDMDSPEALRDYSIGFVRGQDMLLYLLDFMKLIKAGTIQG